MSRLSVLCFLLSFTIIYSANIYLNKPRQVIDGFGGSNAWISYSFYGELKADLQDDLLDALFSTSKGLGLSIFRNRIPADLLHSDGTYDWNTWDLASTAKQWKLIQKNYGLSTIFSSPWTPPAFMKDNNKTVQGSLKSSHYRDYANYLANYILGVKSHFGIELTAISIQNEPDWKPTYESCTWTAAQFHDFIKNHLGPVFDAKKISTKVIFPEAFKFSNELALPTLNDPAAAKYIDIVGVHQYYTPSNYDFSLAKAKGKKIWMTEHCNEDSKFDNSISQAIKWAKEIHTDLAEVEISAYCYWWLYHASSLKNDALVGVQNGKVQISKRSWALGHFSRFIRPNYHRVQSDVNPATGVYLSAYISPDKEKVVIVAINSGTATKSVPLKFSSKIGSLAWYRTSDSENFHQLEKKSIQDDETTISLDGESINTFVGSIL